MANALEAASLIMVPSGYEDGTLGSLKPTDGSGDFTFSRGSNLSATRINEQGYIEKGYENLLLQSNTFSDAAWNKVRTTITGNQTGYDGSNDAWVLECDEAGQARIEQPVSQSGVNSFSVYAKRKDSNYITIRTESSISYATFDLLLGEAVSEGGIISSSIESLANDWYKCTIVYSGSKYIARVYILEDPTDIGSAVIGSSIYIQDAMLNQGLVAYPYIETTTAPVAGGILEDEPRLDWSGSCPSLLLEPSRTNALSHSEFIQGLNFSIGDFISSPEGVANGVGFIPSSSNTTHYISAATSGLTIANSSVVFSFYVKQGTQPYLRGRFDENSFTKRCFFGIDLTDNSVLKSGTGASSVEITFEDSVDGWKKVIFTATYDANPTGTGLAFFLGSADSMGTDIDVYAGDGSTFFHIYGLQVEQGSYPTSYIPTYGVSQTRLQDSCNVSGLAQSFPLTAYIEIDVFSTSVYNQFQFRQDASNYVLRVGNQIRVGTAALSNTNTLGSNKFALSVDASGNFELFKNGTSLGTGTITGSIDEIRSDAAGYEVKQILLFPTALSDSECIALTTIT